MKAIKLIGHQVVLVSIFLLLIIEGEHFGGFYLVYLLMALPHGAVYSLLAAAGIIMLVSTNWLVDKKWKLGFSAMGLVLILFSLFIFFSRGDNKSATFQQGVPLVSFFIFGISVVCFIINSTQNYFNERKKINSLLSELNS